MQGSEVLVGVEEFGGPVVEHFPGRQKLCHRSPVFGVARGVVVGADACGALDQGQMAECVVVVEDRGQELGCLVCGDLAVECAGEA